LESGLPEDWQHVLKPEFEKSYFVSLSRKLDEARHYNTIYPDQKNLFAAFRKTPFEKVKVVIIGQDPYHGKGQANGLAFSVNNGMPLPPSLRNIFKELHEDLGINHPKHGNLTQWAREGVLLLNSVLSVTASKPQSHQHFGWEFFTDAVIKEISSNLEHVVFMLWGRFAHTKETLIDNHRHAVLKAAHPSPLSAYRGFFGCRHFSAANRYLAQSNKAPINWNLTANLIDIKT
jgi:uracil-DNA glycosylase